MNRNRVRYPKSSTNFCLNIRIQSNMEIIFFSTKHRHRTKSPHYLSIVIIIHCHVSINTEQMLTFCYGRGWIIKKKEKSSKRQRRIFLYIFSIVVALHFNTGTEPHYYRCKQITKQHLKKGNFPDNITPLCTKEILSSLCAALRNTRFLFHFI